LVNKQYERTEESTACFVPSVAIPANNAQINPLILSAFCAFGGNLRCGCFVLTANLSRLKSKNISPAKAQRRKESLWKRGSALRFCAFAGEIALGMHVAKWPADFDVSGKEN